MPAPPSAIWRPPGISSTDISLLSSNVDHAHGDPHAIAKATEHGAEAGAGLGGVLGGGAGLLAGLGMLAIPGVGPVIAAGWLMAALAGAGAGAAAGGILGGLAGLGLSTEHVETLAEGVRRGGTLVMVRGEPGRTLEIEEIMDRNRSLDVMALRAGYVAGGWHKFDETAPPYTIDEFRTLRKSEAA